MPARTLDYSPLTAPVSRADVAGFRSWARSFGAPWARNAVPAGNIVAGILGAGILMFLLGGLLASFFTEGVRDSNPIGVALPALLLGILAIAVVAGVRSRRRLGEGWQQWYRLSRLAQANRLRFIPRDSSPGFPGEIFQLGTEQTVLSELRSGGLDPGQPGFFGLGNYRYTTGSGRNRSAHSWGFLALQFDRAMPNIVLDSKSNNSLFGSNLPAVLDRKQILHLEGDFDRHFTLYCPEQYERDALSILTSDLMALLIDEATAFDVELVDRWMFVYSAKPFEMTDPATLQRLFTIADTVGAKAHSQTEHYADERIGDPVVDIGAPQGARLRHNASTGLIIGVCALGAICGWAFASGFLPG
jgi:hypothetical protein